MFWVCGNLEIFVLNKNLMYTYIGS
jgi:hypothetical protein